jgi:adenylate kinase
MILVLLGPPGSGKGTQAKKLVAQHRWPQLSTGDMLRSAISAGTKLGMEAKTYMDKGSLVPDSVVIGLIEEHAKAPQSRGGFILDGFPRTIPQAQALDEMLRKEGRSVDMAVLFEIPDAELVRRLSGRRTCLKDGSMYHVDTLKPKMEMICDQCGSLLVQRDDDKSEVIQRRLSVYLQQTAPLVQYYQRAGKLKKIDATEPPEKVTSALESALKTPSPA